MTNNILPLSTAENVTTPIEAWRNALRLREAHLPLKCKRRIRRQAQKRPVLKQGHLHIAWWRALMLAHWAAQAARRLWRSAAALLRPPEALERRRGRAVAEIAFLRKKCFLLCAGLLLGEKHFSAVILSYSLL